MNSPHSERGRRTFLAEVITDAKEEALTEHPEGTLLGMAENTVCMREWQKNPEKQTSSDYKGS